MPLIESETVNSGTASSSKIEESEEHIGTLDPTWNIDNWTSSRWSYYSLLLYQLFFGGFLIFTTTWKVRFHQFCVNSFVVFGLLHIVVKMCQDRRRYFTRISVATVCIGLIGLVGMIIQSAYFGSKGIFTYHWYWAGECTGLCALQWFIPVCLIV